MKREQRIPVGVIGVGMVGTPLARYFREVKGYARGRDLFLYDIDPAKGCGDDVRRAGVVFVCVPTPPARDGSADTSAVRHAFRMLAAPLPRRSVGALRADRRRGGGGKIVVIKSTVPPGTTEAFQREFPEHQVLFNPENLTERFAWEDFLRPDTQIVGFTAKSIDAAHPVLSLLPKAPFMSPWGTDTYRRTAITATEAEIIKYARNIHFARKVNFANALARLAETMGADYENIRAGMAADHRIGDSHLDVTHGGYRGFGGYCFPKDLSAFIAAFDRAGLPESAALLRSDWDFNKAILAEQGLTIEEVSSHDHVLERKLKEKLERKKLGKKGRK
ncbi:MAG: hypothetical protein A3A44_02300 [Candidatus Sungbacteria bacterium RIFCSPLOWO2_01_FULL_60_25]|uniref:UDP-glucose/GDP-mannose dehydrogenase dimerisation domain-containing protein n=1 Tax=Candidatus Sungbacteria bacterium RIFCSPLOWO2_01_FULL_60_25 TaxID=1802281 RepID=A0A1G2LDJ2_9BACT|nr:MAG: hypothetical protein A3A44_02300 [Candidatus Sungbacteria bacterium RIFCSPLOWO2_01_FULL_60_25]